MTSPQHAVSLPVFGCLNWLNRLATTAARANMIHWAREQMKVRYMTAMGPMSDENRYPEIIGFTIPPIPHPTKNTDEILPVISIFCKH